MKINVYSITLLVSGFLFSHSMVHGANNNQNNTSGGREEIAYTNPQNDRAFYRIQNTTNNTNPVTSTNYQDTQRNVNGTPKNNTNQDTTSKNGPIAQVDYYQQANYYQRGTGHYPELRPDPEENSFYNPYDHGEWDNRTNWRYHPGTTKAYLRGEEQDVYEDYNYQQHMRTGRIRR